MTVFEQIVARELPASIAYEDEQVLAFHDIDPKAPVHVIIVPKRCIPRIAEAKQEDAELLGKLLLASGLIAKKLGVLESGYRLVINNGKDAGETVPHLHVHLLAKRVLAWPPG